MTSKGYYAWLRAWGLKRQGGVPPHGVYIDRDGFAVSVRLPEDLTEEQRVAELRGFAAQHGYELPAVLVAA
jgi:hypothetical protein